MSFKWKLKEKMAQKGIWKCTDLTRLLNAYGINISVSMVSRIVDKMPERINTQVLDALCDILECSPSDIMIHTKSSISIESLVKASGENISVKPGPKPKTAKAIESIPENILGPKGMVIT